MGTKKVTPSKQPDRLQEIANRYGCIIYVTRKQVLAVGWVRHDSVDCERPRLAAQEVANAKGY